MVRLLSLVCGRRFVNSNDDGDFVDGNGRFLCHQSINF